jgi:hypothetical protein
MISVVALVGGTGSFEGVLYATNPATGTYGPVCDDSFTLAAVSLDWDIMGSIILDFD